MTIKLAEKISPSPEGMFKSEQHRRTEKGVKYGQRTMVE